MRLQLIACAAAGVVLAGAVSARGADRAAAKVAAYVDDDGVTVVTPVVRARKEFGEAAAVEAGYTVDVITAASIDVVTAASPRGFTETRHIADFAARGRPRRATEVGATYRYTTENDFSGHSAGGRQSTDLLGRTANLTVDAGFSWDEVRRRGDAAFAERRTTLSGSLAWTQVVDAATQAVFFVAGDQTHGFQANPYRHVWIGDPATGRPALGQSVTERLPATRTGGSGGARVARALPAQVFLQGGGRAYRDTWGITAGEASLSVARPLFADRLTIRADARAYTQGGAAFYRSRYDTFPMVPRIRAADRELGPMHRWDAGLRADATPVRFAGGGALDLTLSATGLTFRYRDPVLYPPPFEPQRGRNAVLLYGGLTVTR